MVKHNSFGTTLSVDLAGGTDFTKVAQILDLAGPNIERPEVDATDHDNAIRNGGDGYREYFGGIPDAGDITVPVHFDPINETSHEQSGTGILGSFTDRTLANWKIELAANSGSMDWQCKGFLNGWSPEAPLEGKHTGEVSIKLSGAPTLNITT